MDFLSSNHGSTIITINHFLFVDKMTHFSFKIRCLNRYSDIHFLSFLVGVYCLELFLLHTSSMGICCFLCICLIHVFELNSVPFSRQARPLMTRALEDGNHDALVDPHLGTEFNDNEMARMIACAAASVRHSGRRRPRMSQVHFFAGFSSLVS